MNSSLNSQPLSQVLAGRNIYLIGMMGSGKSKTGPILAQEIAYSFVDIDILIEKLIGKSIEKIFESEGEQAFREIESKVLQEIGQHHSLIVATGGGVVLSSENWGVLHQGIVVWIDPGQERLLSRLKLDPIKRPLLQKSENLESAFGLIWSKRKPLYAEADLHVTVKDELPDQVAKKILMELPLILNSHQDLNAQQTIE